MKLTKRKDGHYLLVKLNARDRKYLESFRKYEPPKHARNMEQKVNSFVLLRSEL